MDDALFQENDRHSEAGAGASLAELGSFQLVSGASLPVTLAYQTWGTYRGDNAILACHALSGDSNAAVWWERLIGPGRAIDTDRFFVICANVLGGCRGSTGPSSVRDDGRAYGSRFPAVTIRDMTASIAAMLPQIGVNELFAAVGGSMGGMQVLDLCTHFPVQRAWCTASTGRHSAMQIGFNEVGRQAILRDANFTGGDYYDGSPPADGLAVARMAGHLTFLSEASFNRKFGRERRPTPTGEIFEVESYLNYQGDKFTQRFDANSQIVLTRALDAFDFQPAQSLSTEFLLTSFRSDWIYPTWQSEELRDQLSMWAKVRHVELGSPLGHDAFLLDDQEQADLVRLFLQ
ncbi:MAG: homoserine O-acetyltransferase [Chthonomonas sp.]|nr:homoserine O-acetyltransferase [Chthonomonas sp.]